MQQTLAQTTHTILRRRELLSATVAVPYAFYLVAFASGMDGRQLKVVLPATLFFVLLTRFGGAALVKAHVARLAEVAARGDPRSLREVKVALAAMPWRDARVAGSRWLVAVPGILLLAWFTVGLTTPQVIGILLVPLLVGPYTSLLAYLISENGWAPVAEAPPLAGIRLTRAERVRLDENGRRLWLALSVAAMPVTTLAFLFALSASGAATFTRLPLHLGLITAFTAVALGLLVRESARGASHRIGALVTGIEAVARGEFRARAWGSGATDELGFVAQHLEELEATIVRLLGELRGMSERQGAGDLDARLPEEVFQGAYREIAGGVNGMVTAHVALERRAMDTFTQVARGDFAAALPALPGKQRFVNDTLDSVRASLEGLVAELTRVTAAQAAGDVDAALDASRFQGGFRALAEGVNGMAGDQRALTQRLLACIGAFGEGDFAAPLERFPGKKGAVNDTVERLRARLRALIQDVDLLSRAAVEGRFGVRAEAERHAGDYRRIVLGVNGTLEALLAPVRDVAALLDTLAAGHLAARLEPARYREDARALAERVNATVGALLAPGAEATTALEAFARHDLTARMTGAYQGDHARLKDAVNATGGSLEGALAQVSEAAAQVTSAAAQIASSSQAVATGATEQASALQETASIADSVAAMAAQATANAQQANALAQAARDAAREGTAAMGQLQGTMGGVRKSAEATSQIIRDVSDIAFQTNLLALNAAVEAARAGEAGRGFAVVAEEVRSLAMRAKEAATKTEALIRESVQHAGEGEGAAARVSGQLGQIVDGVGKVSAIVEEMASASREQTAGIEQMAAAVGEVDKVTQQNAASAEQSSAAASELNAQAEELAAMVTTFRLERAAGRAAAAPAPRPVRPGAVAGPARNGVAKGHANGVNGTHRPAFPMEEDDEGSIPDF